jgi:hypothetical protein
MVQGVDDEGCRHDAESKVGEDAVRDKGQCPEQDRGLKEVNVTHVGGLSKAWSSWWFYTPQVLSHYQINITKIPCAL